LSATELLAGDALHDHVPLVNQRDWLADITHREAPEQPKENWFMSENSILNKYVRKPDDTNQTVQTEDVEVTEDWGFRLASRCADRALMLELRKKNGNSKAVGLPGYTRPSSILDRNSVASRQPESPYHRTEPQRRDPAQHPAIPGIIRHRVPWVQEADDVMIMKSRSRTR